jgi:3'(2'), 5'-bisphosphate nucleotidase
MFYTETQNIDYMINIIKKCNKEILKIYNTDFEKEYKDDNTPLTLADKISNDIIYNELANLNKIINLDILIISEEIKNKSYDERKNYEWCWIVDPLDGTKEFIKKNDQFTVNIGLVKNGNPVFGIVSIPVSGEIFYGGENLGSYKINKDNSVEKLIIGKNNNPIKIVVSNSHMNEETSNFLKKYNNYECINVGSSIKLLLISENKADLYPRMGPTSEWDICASHAIVKYAGGYVLQYNSDEELKYNKENLLNPYFIVCKEISNHL